MGVAETALDTHTHTQERDKGWIMQNRVYVIIGERA